MALSRGGGGAVAGGKTGAQANGETPGLMRIHPIRSITHRSSAEGDGATADGLVSMSDIAAGFSPLMMQLLR